MWQCDQRGRNSSDAGTVLWFQVESIFQRRRPNQQILLIHLFRLSGDALPKASTSPPPSHPLVGDHDPASLPPVAFDWGRDTWLRPGLDPGQR